MSLQLLRPPRHGLQAARAKFSPFPISFRTFVARRPLHLPVAAAAMAIVALSARFATVGADARWLAAVGRAIVSGPGISHGIPFAAAPSSHFPNALVLAEIAFDGLESLLGDRGLMLAQLVAVAVGVTVLARDALAAGGEDRGVAAAIGIVALGAFPSLAIVRVQLFSVALFPVVVALLRSEARRPSPKIWLLPPIFALWANLHAAVLIGLGVAWCYLFFSRTRIQPKVAVLVAGASAFSVCLTPALLGTVSYFHLGLTNVSVERGFGLWAPLSLTQPFDDVLLVSALVLALGLRRRKVELWELAALAALLAATIEGSRDGIWLLFFLLAPGAQLFRFTGRRSVLAPPILLAGLAILVVSIVRGPLPSGASKAVLARALAVAHGSPILATDILAEQVELAGGHVWLSNPLEAFSHRDQSLYIDWLQGRPSGRQAVTNATRVVLVTPGSGAERIMDRDPGFVARFGDRATIAFVRRPARPNIG